MSGYNHRDNHRVSAVDSVDCVYEVGGTSPWELFDWSNRWPVSSVLKCPATPLLTASGDRALLLSSILWADMCPLTFISILKCQPPILQNVTGFGDGVFKGAIKLQ